MIYEQVVHDFAQRTRHNLVVIDRLKAEGHEVYETTQLVNSMLGLLIFPREHFVKKIDPVSLAQLQADGWPVPTVSHGFTQAKHLRDLIRLLRNAIAHFNVEFIPDTYGDIARLKLWNVAKCEGPDGKTAQVRTWEVVMTVADLRALTERFIDLILLQPEPPARTAQTPSK